MCFDSLPTALFLSLLRWLIPKWNATPIARKFCDTVVWSSMAVFVFFRWKWFPAHIAFKFLLRHMDEGYVSPEIRFCANWFVAKVINSFTWLCLWVIISYVVSAPISSLKLFWQMSQVNAFRPLGSILRSVTKQLMHVNKLCVFLVSLHGLHWWCTWRKFRGTGIECICLKWYGLFWKVWIKFRDMWIQKIMFYLKLP